MGPLARGCLAGSLQLAISLAAVSVGLAVAHAHRTPLLALALLIAALAVAIEAAAQRTDDRLPAAAADRWLARSTSAGVAAGLIGGPFTLALLGRGTPWPLLLVVLGACLRASAIVTLGRDFISGAEAPALLTTRGVYAHFRHPSELGLLLVSGGFALTAPSALTAAGFLVAAVSSALRIRREERALARRFGPLHRAYVRRVSAVLPGLH